MRLFKLKLALALFGGFGLKCADKPTYLVFVRHAEKKKAEPKNLNPTGWKRAERIRDLFTGKSQGNGCVSEFIQNRPIDEIFAHRPTREEPSVRTVETAIPLTRQLGKDLNVEWSKKEVVSLMQYITGKGKDKYEGKTLLFFTSHGRPLKAITKHFVINDITGNWHKSRYDWICILVLQGEKAKLIYLPQQLMSGDQNFMMFEKKDDLNLICPNYAVKMS